MSFRFSSAVLIVFAVVSAAGLQASDAAEYDCAANSGIKLDQTPLVNAIDMDKDGKVSLDEWTAIGAQEGIFTHTDKNADGFMTVQELNDTTPPDAVDGDKDGKLTLPEFEIFMGYCNQPDDSQSGGMPQGGAPQGGTPPK